MIIFGAVLRMTLLMFAVWVLIPDAPVWRIATAAFIIHMVIAIAVYWPKVEP